MKVSLDSDSRLSAFITTSFQSTFTFRDGVLVQQQKKIKPGDRDSTFKRYVNTQGQLVIVSSTTFRSSSISNPIALGVHLRGRHRRAHLREVRVSLPKHNSAAQAR